MTVKNRIKIFNKEVKTFLELLPAFFQMKKVNLQLLLMIFNFNDIPFFVKQVGETLNET